MASCEDQRASLEALELIESAISDRLRRNPELYYRHYEELRLINLAEQLEDIPVTDIRANKIYNIKKSKRSKKQIMFQQHEINQFLEDFRRKAERLKESKIHTELFKDNSLDFRKFEESLEVIKNSHEPNSPASDLRNDYAMFSSSSGAHSNISSIKAQNLDLNNLFSREESYGEFLDLEKFHQDWLNVVKDGSVTLLQFLNALDHFSNEKYFTSPLVDRNSIRYQTFVGALLQYISSFFYKSYPLMNEKVIESELSDLFVTYISTAFEIKSKGYFCVACGKLFKSESIYTSHIPGKKHQKNLRGRKEFLLIEFKLRMFLKYLSKEFSSTKTLVERKLAFTPDERAQEMDRLTAEYDAPVYAENEIEDSSREKAENRTEVEAHEMDTTFDMPLGLDGYPIPYWLYKLQGLDIEYPCEICGNHVYKGRRQFEKHFVEARHLFGLRCLGIEPSSTYKGITSIEEAKDLSSRVQNPIKASSTHKKLEVEVEDDEGNVMSEKVYLELRKQGLF